MLVALVDVYCTVEVLAVNVPVATKGVPAPVKIKLRLPEPISKVVEAAMVTTPDAVSDPVPPWTVMVGVPALLVNVKLLKLHPVLPDVVPKALEEATFCVNVPPVILIAPAVPAAAPLTV